MGIKMHNPCLPHKKKLDAQLYRFGTQPHFCIAYVIGCIKTFRAMAKTKRVGYDYLHNHTGMEKQLNVPEDHVIVDRNDWEEVVRFFNENPEHIKLLGKSKYNIDLGA